ncbi:MAG: anthranilate synthase component I family protein [Flavobacteriales bacterium]|nr:anthranilate synthase component I family protein [Flavobacteriales bacterium]
MRRTIPLPYTGPVDWAFLRSQDRFLYRRIADRDRAVLAVGMLEEVPAPEFGSDGRVDDWVFGALRYEWRNELEPGVFGDASDADADYCAWFIPRYVVEWTGSNVCLHALPGEEQDASEWARSLFRPAQASREPGPLDWVEQCSHEDYVTNVRRLLAHIHRGDIYELNYCTTRSATHYGFDPFAAFGRMLRRSAAPFAGFYRDHNDFVLCASPERFLAFDGDRVMGQPMKGTRPRSKDRHEDARLALELTADIKERSENIMALDVMRHDLSRIAASRSVHVDHLCAVVSLPQVHQMISTVSARMRVGSTPLDAIRAAFPMASMTGAPKVRAMQLIQEAEGVARGRFSGSLGFFAPDGTGDFNVVIRSVLHDAASGRLSITTGSAITALCDPEREWEECRLKARSVIDAICNA